MHWLSLLLSGLLPQILHAYMAEPHGPWAGLQRGTPAYAALKAEKAEVLWGLIEQVGPGADRKLTVLTDCCKQACSSRFYPA